MKMSIGLFLLRVAVNKLHIWLIRFVMLLAAVFGGGFTFVLIFQCWPIRAFWTLDPTDGHCINAQVLEGLVYGISALNVIADWVFALLPAFIVKDLQMPRKRKISVACVMGFACVGSTATIVRLPDVWSMKQSSLGWNGDFLYLTTGIVSSISAERIETPANALLQAIWSTVEVGIGCTAGNMATLWPLVQAAAAKLGMHTTQQDRSGMRTPTFGGQSKRPSAFELDGLKSEQGVRTTISCKKQNTSHSGWQSDNSSQEHLAGPNDITRHVVVEYDESPYDAERGSEKLSYKEQK